MKFRYILPLIGLLFLQSCRHNDVEKTEAVIKEPKLNEAANYNTQLGMAYLKQGDRPRAKRKLLLALSQDPNSPDAHASFAYFMEKSGDFDQAEKYYHKAIVLAHGAGAQLNNYGAFLCRQGKYREAENYFLKAIKDIKYDHTAGAYENAGLCVLAIPDNVNAKRYFIRALEEDPERIQSLYELVKLQVQQGQFERALTYLQKYPNLTLQNKLLLAMASDAAYKVGKYELSTDYKARLLRFTDNTGGKNEYATNNG